MNRLTALVLNGFLLAASVAFAAELTGGDVLYLKENKLRAKYDLKDLVPSQITGLHNVINDPKTQNDARARLKSVTDYLNNAAVNNFFCKVNADYPERCKYYCDFHPSECPTKVQQENIRKGLQELMKPSK